MIDERYQGIAQTLSGAFGTAVSIYENGQRAFSAPEGFKTVESLALGKDFYIGLDREGEEDLIYLTNKYEENYILLRVDEHIEVVFGPYCTTKMTGLNVASVVRETDLPPRSRSKLLDYYISLPIFGVSQNFYIGQLMLALFMQTGSLSVPDSGRSRKFPAEEFSARRVQNRVAQYSHPPYFLEQELTRAVSAGDKPAAFAVLNEYEALEFPKFSDDPLRSEKNRLICFCTILTRAAISGGAATEDAFNLSDIYIGKVEAARTLEELRALQSEIADSFIDLVRTVKSRNYSAPIAETAQYIKAHLSEKLTLPELAELVHLHPNYLSSVFKRETGESVTTYILRQRIYEAAHMLQTTDMTAAEISSFYLFCNQSYFIKTFRRFMGCSPQQYREQVGGLKH